MAKFVHFVILSVLAVIVNVARCDDSEPTLLRKYAIMCTKEVPDKKTNLIYECILEKTGIFDVEQSKPNAERLRETLFKVMNPNVRSQIVRMVDKFKDCLEEEEASTVSELLKVLQECHFNVNVLYNL
ncbi:uncharacterized protein LOC135160430 [Diachasmimorpha longicaudata]|uniref:uncharacterized protein LOC135160430 n=1 Tax=Diachasmimorpha longicaudata TaxID=58733 RepID=UPI0030B8F25C